MYEWINLDGLQSAKILIVPDFPFISFVSFSLFWSGAEKFQAGFLVPCLMQDLNFLIWV